MENVTITGQILVFAAIVSVAHWICWILITAKNTPPLEYPQPVQRKEHAFTCKACGGHQSNWRADVWTCSKCGAVLQNDTKPKAVR